MKTCLLAFIVLLTLPTAAHAQTPPVVNPDSVEFTPSPNHGDPVTATAGLTKYNLKIVATSAPSTVLKIVDMGKPTPAPTGKITVSALKQYFVSLPDGSYAAIVEAEGPGGATPSVLSDPFTVAQMRAPGAPGKPAWKALTAPASRR